MHTKEKHAMQTVRPGLEAGLRQRIQDKSKFNINETQIRAVKHLSCETPMITKLSGKTLENRKSLQRRPKDQSPNHQKLLMSSKKFTKSLAGRKKKEQRLLFTAGLRCSSAPKNKHTMSNQVFAVC